jgi:hypothetical protein
MAASEVFSPHETHSCLCLLVGKGGSLSLKLANRFLLQRFLLWCSWEVHQKGELYRRCVWETERDSGQEQGR